jgi:hypothetical protein
MFWNCQPEITSDSRGFKTDFHLEGYTYCRKSKIINKTSREVAENPNSGDCSIRNCIKSEKIRVLSDISFYYLDR